MSFLLGISKLIRGLLRNERGSTVTFLAAAAVPLVAFIGLSIDTARGYLAKQRLAYAIEAAALAAAKSAVSATDDEIEAAGNRIFNANFPAGYMTASAPTVIYTISPNKREISVSADLELPTALMTVIGIDEVSVSSQATALREAKGLELAITLDNSISMNGHLDDLKDATQDLLDVIYAGDDTVENLWVSIVPFDQRVNLKDYPGVVSFISGNPNKVCANARSGSTYAYDDTPPSVSPFNSQWWFPSPNYGCKASPALALTAEKSTVEDAVDAMGQTGATRIDEGAAWAYRMLSEDWKGLWGDPDLPLAFNTPLMDKVAIIMTDGKNNPYGEYGMSETIANTRLSNTCTDMKANGIIVYTIRYKYTGSGASGLETLLKNCATSADYYFFAEEDELSAVFSEIANQLSNLRLLSVK